MTATIPYTWVAISTVAISMLNVLQAASETSRRWHPFRELHPKDVTTCLDHSSTGWEIHTYCV